jgi:hypothetical protein
MPIAATCPGCKRRDSFPDRLAEQWVECRGCGRSLFLNPEGPPADEPPLVEPVEDVRDAYEEEDVPRRRRKKRRGPRYRNAPDVYYHEACGGSTKISPDIVRMITSDPFRLIVSTYCSGCRRFVGLGSVEWPETGETVADFRARLRSQMHPFLIIVRLLLGPLAVALIAGLVGLLTGKAAGLLCCSTIGFPAGYFVVGFIFQLVRDPREVVRQGELRK